jgi:hypothetical protein
MKTFSLRVLKFLSLTILIFLVGLVNPFRIFAQPEGNSDGRGNPTCTDLDIDQVSSSNNTRGGRIPTNVLDHELQTFWLARGSSAWIQADLKESKIICSVDIAWRKVVGASSPYEFGISVSLNRTTFATIHSGEMEGRIMSPLSHITYDFEDIEARGINDADFGFK